MIVTATCKHCGLPITQADSDYWRHPDRSIPCADSDNYAAPIPGEPWGTGEP